MRRQIPAGNGPLRWKRLLAAAGLAGLGLSGCALSWDDVTSRDFHLKDMWAKPPDPLVVLRDSKDGDKRAKAIRALKEPKLNGGTAQDQDFVLGLLKTASKEEARYYVRLEAVRKLGEFKDPRAVPALVEAYYQADSLMGKDGRDHTVTKGLISTFRCEVLRGLGNNGDESAADLLVRVLSQGEVKDAEQEIRMVLDERMAAARALKNYRQYRSTEALLAVLKNDKDVALRDIATESLQACTGKKLPAEYLPWDDFLHHQPPPKNPEGLAGEKKKPWMELILTGGGGKP
ncbi:MAG TPA: HEAT repeat domain-containing protein [Gemmataceae bacterium]|nr:HEAT repeat domain-containing protein [Gemmataceae bacterium]